MKPLPVQIAICLGACVAAIVATGVILWLLVGGSAVNLQSEIPREAQTAPMIGVVVFWLVGRALKVPLDPIKTFLFGAIIVYGTLYFSGRMVAIGLVNEALGTSLVLLVIFGFALFAIRRAERGGP